MRFSSGHHTAGFLEEALELRFSGLGSSRGIERGAWAEFRAGWAVRVGGVISVDKPLVAVRLGLGLSFLRHRQRLG